MNALDCLSPRLRRLALAPADQIVLAKFSGVRWTPANLRKPQEPRVVAYGQIKALAVRFVAGEFGADGVYDVAARERVNGESLKQSVWKLRNPKPAKQQGRAA